MKTSPLISARSGRRSSTTSIVSRASFVLACCHLFTASNNGFSSAYQQQSPASNQQTTNQPQDQLRQQVIQQGPGNNELQLIGLFDVHLSSHRQPMKCGPIDLDGGETSTHRSMQNLEAFLWAIDQVNEDNSLLPGVQLKPSILDTCSSFLRTNQIVANLLHQDHQHSELDHQHQHRNSPQYAALIADQNDWSSVEAVAQLASAARLTTFVTQSRSTRLNEFIRKFQMAQSSGSSSGSSYQAMPSTINPSGEEKDPRLADPKQQQLMMLNDKHRMEGMLGELLGIGRMMTQPQLDSNESPLAMEVVVANGSQLQLPPATMENMEERLLLVKMMQSNEFLAESLASLCDSMRWDLVSLVYDGDDQDMVDLHDELIRRLFMRNTQLALDELLINSKSSAWSTNNNNNNNSNNNNNNPYERLLDSLARKTHMGARVVITLLQTGAARSLQEHLRQYRRKHRTIGVDTTKESLKQLDSINSLIWITVSDREPYYSMALDSLGTLAVTSSSSVLQDFKARYDTKPVLDGIPLAHLATTDRKNKKSQYTNKWWPEYLRAIYSKLSRELGAPFSPEAERCFAAVDALSGQSHKDKLEQLVLVSCSQVSLSSLARDEQIWKLKQLAVDTSNSSSSSSTTGEMNHFTSANVRVSSSRFIISNNSSQTSSRLQTGKFLANGWEHNGMEVINSVLAVAQALESIRQELCPRSVEGGLCARMRQFLQQQHNSRNSNQVSFESAGDGRQSSEEAQEQLQQATPTTTTRESRKNQPTSSRERPAALPELQLQDSSPSYSSSWQTGALPRATISELVHSELMRLTFPLADGRMFSLMQIDPQREQQVSQQQQQQQLASSFQLETRIRLFNLRFLRQNSIGFVKFGHFDPSGLLLASSAVDRPPATDDNAPPQSGVSSLVAINATKALHYPEMLASISQRQVAIDQVPSTCTDEHKCLMLSSFEKFVLSASSQNGKSPSELSASSPSSPALSEEELAAGVNSLFKLDHPLLMDASSDNSDEQQQDLSPANEEALQVHTMRSPSQMSSWLAVDNNNHNDDNNNNNNNHHHHHQSASNDAVPNERRQQKAAIQVVALLSLHHHHHQHGDNEKDSKRSCSARGRIDERQAFIQLVALAFAQTMTNDNNGRALKTVLADQRSRLHKTRHNKTAIPNQTLLNQQQQLPFELTTRVIDYCDNNLDSPDRDDSRLKKSLLQSVSSHGPASAAKLFIDFDWQTSEKVDRILRDNTETQQQQHEMANQRWLHITVAPPKPGAGVSMTSQHHHKSPDGQRTASPEFIHLMPSKTNEIHALVKLIVAMSSNWRLVHLIYTDRHEYRDEFLQKANEHGICVSKLIWIPAASNERSENKQSLESMRRLFASELYDFSSSSSDDDDENDADGKSKSAERIARNNKPRSGTDKTRPNNNNNNNGEGLNSTRILVVLASANAQTNELIREASSQTMRHDYIWLTTHEWLASSSSSSSSFDEELNESSPSKPLKDNNNPIRHLLATKLAALESEAGELHEFRQYFSHLTPALHSPLPTGWFDEFWQQHFKCRLPILNSSTYPNNNNNNNRIPLAAKTTTSQDSSSLVENLDSWPICSPNRRLDQAASRMLEEGFIEDQILLTLRAIGAFARAASNHSSQASAEARARATSGSELAQHFRREFNQNTAQRASSSHSLHHLSAPLVDFQIVHRLLVASSAADDGGSAQAASNRRTNSRQLAPGGGLRAGQLVRVAQWRSEPTGELLFLVPFSGGYSGGQQKRTQLKWKQDNRTEPRKDDDDDDWNEDELEEQRQVARSLDQLARIKSRCLSSSSVCSLCRQQIERSLAIARFEASNKSGSPLAVSSMLGLETGPGKTSGQSSAGDFDDDDQDLGNNDTVAGPSGDKSTLPNKMVSSSFFDSATSEQVAASELRRVFSSRQPPVMRGWQAGGAGQPRRLGTRGAVLSATLALAGVTLAVVGLVYFYPNMLLDQQQDSCKSDGLSRGKHLNSSCTSITSLGSAGSMANSSYSQQQQQQQPNHHYQSIREQQSLAGSILANLNDYLLLASLLMLHSINVAFVLPGASLSLCSFRRLGLPLSYTILFGSILSMLLNCSRTLSNSRGRSRRLDAFVRAQQQRRSLRRPEVSSQQALDSVDESVEVTFESLPQPQPQPQQLQQPPFGQPPFGESATRNELAKPIERLGCGAAICQHEPPKSTSIKWPIFALIGAQLFGSLVWLNKQPPEPTLSSNSWHCSSPSRSPLLFHYETLLSLIQPTVILIATWFWSLIVLIRFGERRASSAEKLALKDSNNLSGQRRQHRQQLQPEEQVICPANNLGNIRSVKRTLKALVITTTLLLITWTISTLNIITITTTQQQQNQQTSQQQQVNTNYPTQLMNILMQTQQQTSSFDQSTTTTTTTSQQVETLVYSNILSGAIIFFALFVYRLQIFLKLREHIIQKNKHKNSSTICARIKSLTGHLFCGLCCCGGRRTVQKIDQLDLHQQQHSIMRSVSSLSSTKVLKFNQRRDRIDDLRPRFTGSQFSVSSLQFGNDNNMRSAQQDETFCQSAERLHLQQFNSYGSTSYAETGSGLQASGQTNQSILGSNKITGKNNKQLKNKSKQLLQRQRSNGSTASSTARLVKGKQHKTAMSGGDNLSYFSRHSNIDKQGDGDSDSLAFDGMDFDAVSCAAMSVASNSTSQLQGNELYPIDCSLQFDATTNDNAATTTTIVTQQQSLASDNNQTIAEELDGREQTK